MTTINDACEALANVLGTVDGLRATAYIDDQIHPPHAQIYTRDYDPRMVLGNSKRTYMLGVRIFVRRTDPRSAHWAIRNFMEPTGSTSITATVENEDLWDVIIDYAEVTNIGQPFEMETAAEVYMAVDFDIDIVW